MSELDKSYQLWVFNSSTNISELIEYFKKNPCEALILLSSHCLFDYERKQLTSEIKAQIEFLHFGLFNNDEDMEAIDQMAYEQNERQINQFSVYINRFKKSMNYSRNAYIHKALNNKFNIEQSLVFCGSFDPVNLGISFKYWKSSGAIILDISEGWQILKTFFNQPKLEIMVYHIKALLRSILPRRVDSFVFEGQRWNIHSNYRLALKKSLELKKRWIIPMFNSQTKNEFQLIGLHDSGKLLNLRPYSSSKRVVVAGDAYRPQVYPPYLFAFPFKSVYYIPIDRNDLNFFEKYAIRTIAQRPHFMRSLDFDIEVEYPDIKTVILSINHAGDWTALINRSDTDLLIEAFVKLAKHFPELDFVIRPHPTMSGPRAEGPNALKRINKLVLKSSLPNIEVSKLRLEEDWKRGDLFISEYSLSVIDAMKNGKLGLFCNLTGRRSFMDDWEKLGIDCVTSYQELEESLRAALNDQELVKRNRMALERYKKAILLT